MIYLAAPYSHPEQKVKDARMEMFYKYDAELCRKGHFTISPLYKVETCEHGNMPDDWEYWEAYSYELLSKCDSMIVLQFDGWETSKGVQAEIAFCIEHNIPIGYVKLD